MQVLGEVVGRESRGAQLICEAAAKKMNGQRGAVLQCIDSFIEHDSELCS